MSNIKNITNEVDSDYLQGLALLDRSDKASRIAFFKIAVLFIAVFCVIFTVIPRLFTW